MGSPKMLLLLANRFFKLHDLIQLEVFSGDFILQIEPNLDDGNTLCMRRREASSAHRERNMIMDRFVLDSVQNHFLLYCCQWLLPALILHGESSKLQCLAELIQRTEPDLVRSHFVPVFSICMVLYCNKMAGWEKGSAALQSKILQFVEISEAERDMLIKKHMVTIVCQILGLASSASDTTLTFFCRSIVELAVRTVVDGFMELDNYPSTEGVVDKINIFRPDRVFMLLVELHYKVTAAVNERHRSRRLAGIEVLISVLGHRVAVPTTSWYQRQEFGCLGHKSKGLL